MDGRNLGRGWQREDAGVWEDRQRWSSDIGHGWLMLGSRNDACINGAPVTGMKRAAVGVEQPGKQDSRNTGVTAFQVGKRRIAGIFLLDKRGQRACRRVVRKTITMTSGRCQCQVGNARVRDYVADDAVISREPHV